LYHPTPEEEAESIPELKKSSIGFNLSRKIRDVARLRDVPVEFIAG